MPTNLRIDDPIDRYLLGEAHSDAMERFCAIRSVAQRAFCADTGAVRQAWAGRPRAKINFQFGRLVFVARHHLKLQRRGWSGQGVILAVYPSERAIC